MRSGQLVMTVVLGIGGLAAFPAMADVVEFRIAAGTRGSNWNSAETAVQLAVGDTLRIINDDSVVHALHTNDGIPCEHGSDMAPNGGFYDCVIAEPFDATIDGPLYDHYNTDALFWIVAQ